MKKYFVTLSLGLCGYDSSLALYAESMEEAEKDARQECIDFAEMYGFYQDEDHFGDLDRVGRPWDDEESADDAGEECPYQEEGTLEYEAVLFDPELHEGM